MMALAKVESNHPESDHHYLAFVGLEPELQGKGLGTALMRPVLERCERERLPAYLEASSPRNRACYERQGFAVTEEFSFPRGGPPSWRMWREPGAGAAAG
jgi:GNAT superfamily N-acetyltransferase